MIDIKQGDCLELMKKLPDNSIDLIFCDPPYALGSEVIIKPDGKPDYKKAVDFMNKWDQPDGIFWEEWFIEAKRVLKHGGHCLMFGMDRQLWFNCYYANLSGFTQKQSLYWYFISNFPKASDLSKMIDKNAGAEREVVGTRKRGSIAGRLIKSDDAETLRPYQQKQLDEKGFLFDNTTAPTTDLAKKYDGFKYSIAPLKQVVETIMVFQKPYKTGSCLHDVLAMEGGDDTITCGGVDIEGNRCATDDIWTKKDYAGRTNPSSFLIDKDYEKEGSPNGRFPAQTYIDSGASEIIDLQSGVSNNGSFKAGSIRKHNVDGGVLSKNGCYGKFNKDGVIGIDNYGDSGGASRILHKCDFSQEDVEHLLITKEVETRIDRGGAGIQKRYSDLGYEIPTRKTRNGFCVPYNTKIWVNVFDLPDNSVMKVNYYCKYCNKIDTKPWRDILGREDHFRCNHCAKTIIKYYLFFVKKKLLNPPNYCISFPIFLHIFTLTFL